MVDEIFRCSFIQNKNKKILIFHYEDFPVFAFEEVLDGGINSHTSLIVQFYSAFFYLKPMQFWFKSFIKKYKGNGYITRVDLALDVPISIPKFIKKGYKTNFIRGAKFGLNERDNTFQTWYLGAKGSTNKKHFIRVYDKLLDSKKKSKMGLFLDYFVYENVTRIEAQINSQSCRTFGITPGSLLNDEFIRKVFRSTCINPRGTIFNYLKPFDDRKKEIINYSKPSKTEILNNLDYAKVMLGYAKTLQKMDFDPIKFLRDNLKQDKNQNNYSTA